MICNAGFALACTAQLVTLFLDFYLKMDTLIAQLVCRT